MVALIVAVVSIRCWAGPLEDYLANPPKFKSSPWRKGREPENVIPQRLKELKEGKTDRDKAIAVGNLFITARRMSYYEESLAAAIQLMDQHVLPNMDVTKRVDITLFCSWRILMLDCADFYKKQGDLAAAQRCLERYIDGVEVEADRNHGLELLARNLAAQKEYINAIKVINLLGDDQSLRKTKSYLIGEWTKELEKQ